MKRAVPIASFVLILTAQAAAQPGTAPALGAPPGASPPAASTPMTSVPSPAPPAAPQPGERDESTALLLSLGGTAASWTMVFAGSGSSITQLGLISTLVTPGFGHWYAGDPSFGWLALRAGALVAFIRILSACEDECSGGTGLAYLSLALYAVGTFGDIYTAPAAARRYNDQHRARRELTVAPLVLRHTAGVLLGARF